MKCAKCGSDMWDNRGKNEERLAQGLKAMPDYKCKNCDQVIWPSRDNSKPTPVGEYKKEVTFGAIEKKAETPVTREPIEDQWAPVSRENMAKKALDISANFYAKMGIDDEMKIFTLADECYKWLKTKREGEVVDIELISEILDQE